MPASGASGADGGSSGPTLAAQWATKRLPGVVRCMVPFSLSRTVLKDLSSTPIRPFGPLDLVAVD